jgi:hypothetical protein
MPKRVVEISWHSIDNGRVGPHCGVDGTTPCRGADLSPLNSVEQEPTSGICVGCRGVLAIGVSWIGSQIRPIEK